ncbi:MAG: hypothetical protein H0U77_13440 [Nocardioidaceae bacterium]|nr:hypothetical protein [Nocardioidaceae bacterium]
MQSDTLSPGAQLAGRYRIEDLVGETARSQTWRAVDRILNRSVSVQVVRSDDAPAPAFLTAARAATVVEDPRFLRVLDAAAEDGYAYVVREWARGVSLDTVLQQGPLPAPRAAELVREVAEAIAAAHRAGVQHGRIDPARIIVKHNGAVRVLGLATDKALHAGPASDAPTSRSAGEPLRPPTTLAAPGVPEATAVHPQPMASGGDRAGGLRTETTDFAPELADVTALGRLLYACLVARWPGGRDLGLPAAPTEHGRLLRPRQVRAGVDRSVDAVCDRILGSPPRHHAEPLRSAAEVARELQLLMLAGEAPPGLSDVDDTSHAGLPLAPDPAGPPPAVHQIPPPRSGPGASPPEPPPRSDRHTGARGLVWVGIALLVAIAAALAFVVGRVGSGALPLPGDDEQAATRPPRTVVQTAPLDISAVAAFDPQGVDGEHDEQAPLAVDGDPASVWTTVEYYDGSGLGTKDGVGLLVDLGGDEEVRRVGLTLVGGPTSVSVLAAADSAAPPTSVDDLATVAEATDIGQPGASEQVSLTLDKPATTRYVVVWLTKLPPVSPGVWVGSIGELVVAG